MTRKKILVVDDHPLVRNGLRAMLDGEPDLIVYAEAANMNEALQILAKGAPDLAIIDISLPDGNGLDLVRRLLARYPRTPTLIASMYDESLYAERALRAGAKGYINKQEAGEEIIAAIKQILMGKIYVSPQMREHLLQEQYESGAQAEDSPPIHHLSDRELQVFEFIGNGLSTREIADTLRLSVKTIETHRANIKKKLGLESACELTRSAVQWTLEPT